VISGNVDGDAEADFEIAVAGTKVKASDILGIG
jgi:hypothetical protein